MKRIVVIISCAMAMFLASCQKELSSGEFMPYTTHPLNDTIWAGSLPGSASVHGLRPLLSPAITIDSFNTTKDTTLVFGDSLEISFRAGSCINPSDPAAPQGTVKLELFRLKTKGDYIKAFKPTTSDGYLLEAAAAFFMRVSKDGKELVLASGTSIKIRFAEIGEPTINMQAFNGKESIPPPVSIIDTDFNWLRDTDSSWIRTFQKTIQTGAIKGYEMVVKNLGWIAAEKYLDSTAPKAKLSVILSPNFTNKNTAVFAVLADHKTVVSLKADYTSRSFAAPNIPKGKKIKIISISKIGDNTYLGTKDVEDIGTTAAFSIKPEKKSLHDIVQLLNGL